MRFEPCTIEAIKSISQKTLAYHWSRCAGQNDMPAMSGFKLPDRGHDPNYLAIWQANRASDFIDFVAAFQGNHLATAFKQTWMGRSMTDLIPKPLRPAALTGAEYCVRRGRGVYMIYRTSDPNGKPLDCERMLLPLSDGSEATHMIASMELFSRDGNAALSDALSCFTRSFEIVFSGCFAPTPFKGSS